MRLPHTTDESNIGIWLWMVELLLVNAWIPLDIWLGSHHHEFLTTEFREGLANPGWNLVLTVLTVLTILLFVAHMWWKFL